MYNGQWDDESDHDKDSLGSSFWSDGEHEEEEEKVERAIGEEDSKPAEESVPEAPELNERTTSSESGSDEDHDEGSSCSCDSPAPSLMTSGYGTYRPEEQDGGDDRDGGSEAAFDQDSRGDLSDEEDDALSLCSWEPDRREGRPPTASTDDKACAAARGHDGVQEDGDIRHMNAEGVAFEHEATNVTSAEEEEERMQEAKEENDVESDESSSNRDIKFINCEVDFSRMMEGNLRPQKGKQ